MAMYKDKNGKWRSDNPHVKKIEDYGGEGSGHHGHKGRPGEVGGSGGTGGRRQRKVGATIEEELRELKVDWLQALRRGDKSTAADVKERIDGLEGRH